MPTISKAFSEIYGENGPLNFRKNTSINNLAKNIVPNQEFNNNVTKNMNVNKDVTNVSREIVPSSIPWGPILFIVVILIIVAIIYYYKDYIYSLFDKINKIEQSIKEHELNKHNDKDKEEKGGINELNTKINNVTTYKDKQKVKENGFCYIGYDNGQRECTNVFDGDICMSGDVFPTMDVCINPHLRV